MYHIDKTALRVNVYRGTYIESNHEVAAVIVDDDGRIIESYGDINAQTFPRSAVKPLQALSYVLSGAHHAQGSSLEHLALACASHSGEAIHCHPIIKWLSKLGLSEKDLECGPHTPMDQATHEILIRQGMTPTAIHNNCSGKHTAIMATCLHLGHKTRGYREFDHPIQKRLTSILQEWCRLEGPITFGTDGCSIPTIRMSLLAMAMGCARVAGGGKTSLEQSACHSIIEAMATYPILVSGTKRFCLESNKASGGRALTKVGAEGLYTAILPQQKWGLALKAKDGSSRAAEAALSYLLERHQLFEPKPKLLFNTRNEVVGKIVCECSTT